MALVRIVFFEALDKKKRCRGINALESVKGLELFYSNDNLHPRQSWDQGLVYGGGPHSLV